MAIQQDWILRVIERLGDALGGWLSGEPRSAEVDKAVEALVGLSVERLDAMPAALLCRMLAARTDHYRERVLAVAEVLEALAEKGDSARAASRTRKAQALRDAVDG